MLLHWEICCFVGLFFCHSFFTHWGTFRGSGKRHPRALQIMSCSCPVSSQPFCTGNGLGRKIATNIFSKLQSLGKSRFWFYWEVAVLTDVLNIFLRILFFYWNWRRSWNQRLGQEKNPQKHSAFKTSKQNVSLFALFLYSTIWGTEMNSQNFTFSESTLFVRKMFWPRNTFHAPLSLSPLKALKWIGLPPPASWCGFHVNCLKPEISGRS